VTVAADTGARTAVVAAAAPLWASAEDAQHVAPFGASSYSAYREWVRARLPDQAPLSGRLRTVALSGEPVRVIATAGPSLAEVELLAQPNGPSGYVGFIHAAHVGADARREATHVVAAPGALAATANRDAAPLELPAGTTVELLARAEAQGPAEVLLASGVTVRCPMTALRALGSPLGAVELLAIAAGFVGAPYLWGGIEAAGIDCSGLVHLAARIGGHVVPRDAHHQWAATRLDVGPDDLDVGDLLFFGDDASLEGIDHVGLYAGDGRMLHAPEAGRSVGVEPISTRARERTVGIGRYPAH
jgi:gamma-D-glutamyl-L-lysine dipeptidyl-peptidase